MTRITKSLLFRFMNTKLSRLIPDKQYISLRYRAYCGKKLNLKTPITFNEKLQWLKLHDRKARYTKMVDKYEVREYIKEKIGEEYLIPLLGVYDRFEDIDFDKLPSQFVLKPNHTSGNVFICTDKYKVDYKALKKEVDKWMKREYYWVHREWPYKNIKPRIICEKYMVDESGAEPRDYKFFCFDGEVKFSYVTSNRNSSRGLKMDFYDMDWNLMPFEIHYPNSGKTISKPKNYDKMIEFAEILSKEIPFVRVDYYEVKGQLYFGELTFFHGAGFREIRPKSYNFLLGSWLELPDK